MTEEIEAQKPTRFAHVAIVMNRRRGGGESRETREAIRALMREGGAGAVVTVDGISCLPLARNTALTTALRLHRKRPELTHMLLLDDDIAFEPEHVEAALAASTLQTPAGCVYLTEDNRAAGVRCAPGRWLLGLGFVVFQFATLEALAARSVCFPTDQHPDGVYEFTNARTIHGLWHSDDYYLARRLGGYRVVGVVGHVKPVALLPRPEDVPGLLAEGEGPFYSAPLPEGDPVLEILEA